jgi:2-dehydropantoate 2-reductase
MRVAVFGAGAIGGVIAARMARAGHAVTVVARGAHLAAMRARGLTVTSAGETIVAPVRAIEAGEEGGPQDVVFVTVKAHALRAAAPAIARLMGDAAALVPAVNGVPYWYFAGEPGPHEGRALASVDPDGVLLRLLPAERVIGCVVYPAATLVAPGRVEHGYGDRLLIGRPDGGRGEAIALLSAALTDAGFKAPIRPRIRDDIWMKLLGNLSFNPLSVLTGATLDRLAGQPELRGVARAMMREGQTVAEALGVRLAVDLERRLDGAGEVGAHKTSMLQDFERGRPIELDALLGAVVELGDLVGAALPLCRAVLALTRERARSAPGGRPPAG